MAVGLSLQVNGKNQYEVRAYNYEILPLYEVVDGVLVRADHLPFMGDLHCGGSSPGHGLSSFW